MTTYNVANGEVGKHAIPVSANVEDIVQFANDCTSIEVVVLASTAPVYFTLDDTTATVAGPDCHVAFAGPNAVEINLRSFQSSAEPNVATPTKVRLISSASATVSVVRA